jgi:hypothetical protein
MRFRGEGFSNVHVEIFEFPSYPSMKRYLKLMKTELHLTDGSFDGSPKKVIDSIHRFFKEGENRETQNIITHSPPP